MKLLLYFFYTIAVLAIITFTYDLVMLGIFDWSSLAITFCMIGVATGLKKNTKKIQSKVG
ncbi:hypothetical protein [Lysinibacillus fusiformis]|uniref:hypothetical protein n=1 Tax=Lysinibacillus fusiformis TaxID=28031 RepID=UPI00215AB7CC|nr:hypothetical protein [Lysinibacillus fusiformis]MCR8854152.1 hypothetical protein [Lysinibacillus fusiformis]